MHHIVFVSLYVRLNSEMHWSEYKRISCTFRRLSANETIEKPSRLGYFYAEMFV